MPPPTRRDPPLPAEGPATNSNTMSATINSKSHMANTVESWVEIASQPSSSSLSSIADEIVITGLRVGANATGVNGGAMPATAQQQPQRRRRLLQQVEQVEAAAGRPPTSHPTNDPSTPATATLAPRSSAGSSQEEYDETESEEDRVLSSSTEHLDMADAGRASQSYSLMQYQATQARLRQRAAASDGDDEDDDDDGTALGILSSGPPTFRPQPNAFSHPPTHLQQQQHHQQQQAASHRSVPTPHHMAAGGPYAPRSSRPARNSAPNFMYPSYREDNDAALRASLTTLLSCAAAARGLPKKENTGIGGFVVAGGGGEPSSSTANAGVRPSNQPMGLRFVPESELGDDGGNEAPVSPRTRARFHPPRMPPHMSSNTQPTTRSPASFSSVKQHAASSSTQQQQHQQQHHSSRNSAVSAVSTSSKSKRAGASKSSPRVTKKKRTSSAAATEGDSVTMISPTLLTWVVSAGVVVLVSVVGFGAGFVIGREVGRQEAAASMSAASAGSSMPANGSAASASTACGREIMRSSTGSTLRRFRWGGMTKSVAA